MGIITQTSFLPLAGSNVDRAMINVDILERPLQSNEIT